MNFKFLLFISAPLLVTFSVFGVEKNLKASAGSNQIVKEKSLVHLDASSSTHRPDALMTYVWVQVGGPDVVLKGMTHIKATFKAPELTTNEPLPLAFELTVDDGDGHSNTDIVRVVVMNVNNPPQVNIDSPGYVDEESPVILDASASSDSDNDSLDYLWRQVGGPSVVFSHPGIPMAVFTSPSLTAEAIPTLLVFELTVRDDCGASSTSTVRVHVVDRFTSRSEVAELTNKAVPAEPLDSMGKFHESKKEWHVKDLSLNEMEHAKECFKKGVLAKARGYCERSLILNPENEEAFNMIQQIQQMNWALVQGELKQAKEDFIQRDYLGCMRHINKVKESDPFNREANKFGVVSMEALQQGASVQPIDSDKSGNVPIGKNKKNSELSRRFYNEGLICYSQGQVRQALAVWKKSWSLDPENKMAMNAFNRASFELK